jgi:P4 family phage/plasmid primase-like protien
MAIAHEALNALREQPTLSDFISRAWSLMPLDRDKTPRVAKWKPYQTTAPTEEQLRGWLKTKPPAWAVITGALSACIVIDFDGAKGTNTMRTLNLEPHVRTGSGGYHAYFFHPGWEVKTRNSGGKEEKKKRKPPPWDAKYPGVDIKGDGGYAACLGSNDDGQYIWLRDYEPYSIDVLPDDLRVWLDLVPPEERPKPKTRPHSVSPSVNGSHHRVSADLLLKRALEDQAAGMGRNPTGFHLALQLRDNGYSEFESESVMRGYQAGCRAVNTKGRVEPYTEAEAMKSLRSAYSQAPRDPWEPLREPHASAPLASAPYGRLETKSLAIVAASPDRAPDREPEDFDVPPDADDLSSKKKKDALPVHIIADEISAKEHFAQDRGKRLYVYRNGVYLPKGDAVILPTVRKICERRKLASAWTSHKAREVVEYIRVASPDLWEAPPSDKLNLKNGILNVDTHELEAHCPRFLSTVQLPVAYDPSATCPAWDKFISDVFPSDSIAVVWELIAWVMTPDMSIQKSALLIGEGENGKSAFLRAIVSFIGKQNTTAASLHKLEQDKFTAARLFGKLANICPDLPSVHLSSTSMFKALTGGDYIVGEYKYLDSFEFAPFAKLLFSANVPPRSDDSSHGFFRRWAVIPFLRCFEDNDPNKVSREVLDARLSDPAEQSGVLNKALHALKVLRKTNRFTEGESMRKAADEFRSATDPLTVWLDQNTELDPEGDVIQSDLRDAYNDSCQKSGRGLMTATAFGLSIKRARPKLEKKQLTKNLKMNWCYVGIRLKPKAKSEGK